MGRSRRVIRVKPFFKLCPAELGCAVNKLPQRNEILSLHGLGKSVPGLIRRGNLHPERHGDSSHLDFGVGWDVGLPAHRVEAVVGDLLILGQRVVRPGHLDGVVAQHRGLHAHGRHHGRGVWYWGVWSMEEFVEVNIGF